MPPRLSWRKLLPGLAALTVIALITVGVLLFAGVGRMRGRTVRLYVLTDQATGVMKGTEVWLFGQKVGAVDQVTFASPTADSTHRVVIAVDVRASDAHAIRRDAPVEVRAGSNIIGPVVVYLESGDPNSPPVRNGDTLRAQPQTDIETASAKLSGAVAELPALMQDAHAIVAHLHDRRGTIGAALSGEANGEINRLRATVARARAPRASMRAGAPMQDAKLALARVDSIRALLRSDRSSLGRFRRDSTLGRSVASVRDELAALQETMSRPDGTLQRWKMDSALTRSIADARREMTLLFDDLRRRPLRYFPF